MTKDLGVWTHENCALVLIDYQKEMFETIRSETGADLAELNVRLLARAAKAFNVPIVLSTVGVAYRINSPTQPAIAFDLPGVEPLDRTSMNAFEDRPFHEAVERTGRKRLIVGGLHTEICLAFAVLRRDVCHRRSRWPLASRAPDGYRTIGARWRRADYRACRRDRTVPGLGLAPSKQCARRHLLVLR